MFDHIPGHHGLATLTCENNHRRSHWFQPLHLALREMGDGGPGRLCDPPVVVQQLSGGGGGVVCHWRCRSPGCGRVPSSTTSGTVVFPHRGRAETRAPGGCLLLWHQIKGSPTTSFSCLGLACLWRCSVCVRGEHIGSLVCIFEDLPA